MTTKGLKPRSNIEPKKAAPVETTAEETLKIKEDDVVLDTLLKISETVLANQKTLGEIQKMQKAGRF